MKDLNCDDVFWTCFHFFFDFYLQTDFSSADADADAEFGKPPVSSTVATSWPKIFYQAGMSKSSKSRAQKPGLEENSNLSLCRHANLVYLATTMPSIIFLLNSKFIAIKNYYFLAGRTRLIGLQNWCLWCKTVGRPLQCNNHLVSMGYCAYIMWL